ncbi:GNAT family N-acetyltransferase [Pseudomonas corrugata]|uniref:GNAT family N-acetyltransferase n=1 Tax=Pseudomonas corrugata TaxID=47879 RepID=A0A8B6UYV3_9PSED|nr:GNAT family N-acetyltransferase [Pseudomonas corrugata]MDU9025685.1 GNAT family N-acetyltransferase [Pseudomonas corrugata]QTH17080.1 GNAT family N-acetyltransferase [Pseudomonas corrugata]
MAIRFQWCRSLSAELFPTTAYEQLRTQVADTTPFNTLAWLQAAELALRPDQELHVLLGWQDQALCLCLPLVTTRERIGGLRFRVLRHLGYPLADRIALLVRLDADAMGQALMQIRQHLPHALLQFNEVIEPVGEESALSAWMALSSTGERRLSCRVPVHLISDSDRQEISGDPRYKLRRARKRIAACGARIQRVTPDAIGMGPLLRTLAEVEAASWKGEEGVGIFSDPRHRQWMNHAFTALAAEGLVRVVMLELDGHCISYRLGLLEHGRLYDYNLAFLPEHADLGSGRVLLEEWIRWGLDDNWHWIDASRVSLENSNHQLHERMTGQLEHWRWSFYSWQPGGLALGFALRLWKSLKPWLRKRPTGQTTPLPSSPPPKRQENVNAPTSDRQC